MSQTHHLYVFREHVELINGQQTRKKLFYALISSHQFLSTPQEIATLGMVKPLKVIVRKYHTRDEGRIIQIIFRDFRFKVFPQSDSFWNIQR